MKKSFTGMSFIAVMMAPGASLDQLKKPIKFLLRGYSSCSHNLLLKFYKKMEFFMSISQLFGPSMAPEVEQLVFSFLLSNEQFKNRTVCKEWAGQLDDLLNRTCWKPNFMHFNLDDGHRIYTPEEIKSAVLAHFQKYKELPRVIINLIDEDDKLMNEEDKNSQLALIIGDSSVSLFEFKEMLPIKRMLHVMRGLRENSTELFRYLAKRHQKSYADVFTTDLSAETNWDKKPSSPRAHQFHLTDPCLSLILKLIKEPPGPLNGSAVMSAICPLIEICSSQKMVRDICAEIVKSHYDLTIFFNAQIILVLTGTSFPEGGGFIHDVLKPQMERYNPDVTDDDWRACGLHLPQ